MKRRPALVGKNVNSISRRSIHKNDSTHSSPTKKSNRNSQLIDLALRKSPVRQVSLSPQRRTRQTEETSIPFKMFEETSEMRANILEEHQLLLTRSVQFHDENEYEDVKENVSPTKIKLMNRKGGRMNSKTSIRKPLQDLDIMEYKGYIENPQTNSRMQLTLHTNGKVHLPSFVTPPRKHKLKDYFTSNNGDHNTNLVSLHPSKTTDDIDQDKVVRKLEFKICEN